MNLILPQTLHQDFFVFPEVVDNFCWTQSAEGWWLQPFRGLSGHCRQQWGLFWFLSNSKNTSCQPLNSFVQNSHSVCLSLLLSNDLANTTFAEEPHLSEGGARFMDRHVCVNQTDGFSESGIEKILDQGFGLISKMIRDLWPPVPMYLLQREKHFYLCIRPGDLTLWVGINVVLPSENRNLNTYLRIVLRSFWDDQWPGSTLKSNTRKLGPFLSLFRAFRWVQRCVALPESEIRYLFGPYSSRWHVSSYLTNKW